MTLHHLLRATALGAAVTTLTACGFASGDSGFGFGGRGKSTVPMTAEQQALVDAEDAAREASPAQQRTGTIWELFDNAADPNTTIKVNKYIWNASLDILNFLPVETVDPFTGVIVTGYGTPPGGGRAYRATVYVQDPALDARSLKVSLQTRGGASVSRDTQRAVEDAILTRARQLRIRDDKL
ncbi:DUF3576 domain-containing protein [Pseudorhodobacter ferrugineus]|uniref:DUF3576 domain-containing protein n=1 Tax=Pseudorhodobacter ferrugineus TaxID=77008 RepID=UPI0003B60DBD|nr:DUF3576 domain-containing protein [Pseudorhodobacter ferrugineus]